MIEGGGLHQSACMGVHLNPHTNFIQGSLMTKWGF